MSLTQEKLKKLLTYNTETGIFKWHQTAPKRNIFKAAGSRHVKGYWTIWIENKNWMAHKLAWLYVYGYVPEGLDHINRDRADNRITNLRLATRSQNQANTRLSTNNTSGYKGVFRHTTGKWAASIKINKKTKFLGTFTTVEQAHEAYKHAAIELFGSFACFK